MKVILKNIMESIVLQKLDETVDKLGCCTCDECRRDIASYALNLLPSKYVVTPEGEMYSKLNALSMQYEADLLSALSQATQVVSQKCRHKPLAK
ncbi:late competence development ComFB family protein [Aminipila butyrica]|uniref:Late competence development ComFB family protein n=1 Tax=Aminipila butyrica TaxID=433296 RepID=A0A858BVG5_9FIRM|nr:late competence development ComFB family protein [Aminipila butyrica]QIB68066.1 late competence development ComFB family protein [Aminipila butyrica]